MRFARLGALATLSLTLLAAPLAGEAQAGKVYRLALVSAATPVATMTEAGSPVLQVLFSELRRLGYAEGRNLVVDRRSGGARRESYPDVAREVVSLGPDVIFADSGRMAQAMRAATQATPIVTITSDPVTLGSRPAWRGRVATSRASVSTPALRSSANDSSS